MENVTESTPIMEGAGAWQIEADVSMKVRGPAEMLPRLLHRIEETCAEFGVKVMRR